jgi:hypothetical protein
MSASPLVQVGQTEALLYRDAHGLEATVAS